MDEFLISFIEEVRELLFKMESDLLVLEHEPEDLETINKVFRVMHTIKGAAHMYGFDDMQTLTHEFETLYQKIRSGKIVVNSEIIDETLHAKDLLLQMLNKQHTGGKEDDLIQRLISKYELGSVEGTPVSDKGKPTAGDKGMNTFCVFFMPDEEIFTRGLSPDRLIDDLTKIGASNILIHEKGASWAEQKEKKICQTSWEIYLGTDQAHPDIEDHFLFYDSDEYRLFDVIDNKAIADPGYKEHLLKYYPKNIKAEDHLLKQIKHLVLNPEVPGEPILGEPEKVEEKSVEKPKADHHATINVSSAKLDELMNLVSELVISTAVLEAQAEKFNNFSLKNSIETIEKLTKKFRNNALDLRLIPVGTLLNKFNRHVRDLSKQLNKSVKLIIEGQDTEIDKTILKSIENPLLHIIRNSIDHGLESEEEREVNGKSKQGLLKITAFYSGPNVVIQVQDDGRGIDFEKVIKQAIEQKLIQPNQEVSQQDLLSIIMEPGFSTSAKVSMVSGRGVGMDVVKKELGAVSGSIEIDTEKGLGTSITMKLPTTLSIIDTLMIEVDKSRILIPLLEIEYCFKEKHDVLFEKDNKYIRYKNEMVPYISLREKFSYPRQDNEEEMIVVINKYDKKYALLVDRIVGEHQAVIKSLGGVFSNQPYFSGGSIMVDGSLALILDTNHLFLN
jgi:two-component system chemotaxis sensor kinase CheA